MSYFRDTVKGDLLATRFILVVEDDREILKALEYTLQHTGRFHVIPAMNGFQALSIMRWGKPDLFLFDYHLPDMNGVELYNRLHADRKFMSIPVLFLSANPSKTLFEELHLSYISKPFELQDLLQKIEDLL